VTGESGSDLRFLKGYAFASTTAIVVLAILGFRQMQHPHFKDIDVQRINVVEPSGTLRMTISNHARLPDPVIGGKSYPLRSGTGGAGAGIIFFNDEGNENGGLTFTGRKTKDGYSAGAGLTFDQFNQDETVTLSYGDENGENAAGLNIADRPAVSIQAFAESAMVYKNLPDGPEKTQRMQAFREREAKAGNYGGANRMYVGKGEHREAILMLADPKGHARIRMTVDSLGAPVLAFLDSAGKVTYQLPEMKK
jgi:hypothetical protein